MDPAIDSSAFVARFFALACKSRGAEFREIWGSGGLSMVQWPKSPNQPQTAHATVAMFSRVASSTIAWAAQSLDFDKLYCLSGYRSEMAFHQGSIDRSGARYIQ